MIFKKSLLVLVTVVILSASLFVSGCSRGRMQNTTETLDMSLSITTSAPTPAPTTAKETTSVQTTTKSATTQAPTTQEATTAAPTTTKPTTAATTTRPTTAKPTTQEATTAAPTTTQAPTTQATTAAPTTQETTEAPTETTLPLHYNKVDTALFVQQSFAEVNKMRAEVGAAPVVMAPQIVQDYAMLRAREEGENWSWVNDTDHQRPNGEWAMEELDRLYYAGTIKYPLSENGASADLWRYTGAEMTRDYVESAGHYNNIIDTRAGSVAIGYYYNEKLWVAFQIIIFLEK